VQIHGNVCLAAVVVTETLDWKLHGFDLLSEHTLPPENALQQHALAAKPLYLPAEVAKGDWAAVQGAPPWAVDAWGLGCLMQEVRCQTVCCSGVHWRHAFHPTQPMTMRPRRAHCRGRLTPEACSMQQVRWQGSVLQQHALSRQS
jgi:hypothetical protein